jgi:hypothetical protein
VVVVERAVTDVPRPTLFDIVIVWDEVTVGRLVKISSSSVLPSLQLPTEKVNLKSFASIRDKELQLLLKVLTKLPEVTADTLNAGTLISERQAPNISRMFVTAAVLNSGTVVKELQLLSIVLMSVTAAVLNSGTVVNEVQLLNIWLIFVTAAVLNKGTDSRELQLLNMPLIFVTAAVLNKGTDAKEPQLANIVAML